MSKELSNEELALLGEKVRSGTATHEERGKFLEAVNEILKGLIQVIKK